MASLLLRNKAFVATKVATRQAKPRVLVVRAQQQNETPALASLAKPAATVAAMNLLMAAPAFAEAGKLFVSDARTSLPQLTRCSISEDLRS